MSSTNSTLDRCFRPTRLVVGLASLALSLVASFALTAGHITKLQLPGCGTGSPCEQLTESAWGKLPLLDWPVSFIGLAYFVALLFAWTAAYRSGSVSTGLKNLVRFGAAVSMMFVIVIFVQGHLCWYCLATHAGNLAFLVSIELAPKGAAAVRRSVAWIGGAFAAVTVVEVGALGLVGRVIEQQRAESTQRIIDAPDEERLPAFTGRYRLGPAAALIRIVVISDYQCPDCRNIEFELKGILSRRDDVSLSAKQFPFCTGCNPHVTRNMHPNACWAARAAEAAGILRGNAGFWQMHRWLFDHQGSFTDSYLRSELVQFGYDPAEFESIMQGTKTLELVQGDIEEAMTLGLFQTPMIFINGVELKGWQVPGTLSRAVAAVAASKPPTATASADRPMSAL
ncbi:MAG: thioredoxin domain-containing protein, partial [Phycisphaerales bacterium]